MEFEKYDPDRHADDVVDSFSGDVVRPQDIGMYREAVEEAIEDVEEIFGIEADFKVVIAEVDTEKLRGEFGEEIPPPTYFKGYSLGKSVHGHAEDNIIYLATSDQYEWWRPGLQHLFVHEEAHQEFYVLNPEMEHEIWESIIFEGHAIYREEEVKEKKGYNWKGVPDTFSFDGDPEKVKQELDKNREWEGDKYDRDNTSALFSFGGEEWENAEGYIIAFEVYQDILERNSMEVDRPILEDESWQKEEIRKSIDKLYG